MSSAVRKVDVLVIGGGPAGISAALSLSRTKRTVALFDSGLYRNANAVTFHTVPGEDGGSPSEWRTKAQQQLVQRYSSTCQIYRERIVELQLPKGQDKPEQSSLDTLFAARSASGDHISAKKVILATGVHDKLAAVKGLDDIWGKQAIHCVYCHGTETAGKPLAVLMTKSPAINGLLLGSFFKKWYNLKNRPLYVLTDGLELEESAGITPAILNSAEKNEVQWIKDPIAEVKTSSDTSPVTVLFEKDSREPLVVPYIATFAEQIQPSQHAQALIASLEPALGAHVHPVFGVMPTAENKTWSGPPNFNPNDPRTNVPGLFWAGNSGNVIANVNIAVVNGQAAGVMADDAIAEEEMRA